MERLVNFGNSLPGVLSLGLIWGIMAIGLYITYKILNLSDLTVDGSFCTGGAVCIVMMATGSPTWLAMLFIQFCFACFTRMFPLFATEES